MNSALASQVNSFIREAENQKKEVESITQELDKLCVSMLTMLCTIGASTPGGLTAEGVQKISIPTEPVGSLVKKLEYLRKGFEIVSGVVHDYGSVTSTLKAGQALVKDPVLLAVNEHPPDTQGSASSGSDKLEPKSARSSSFKTRNRDSRLRKEVKFSTRRGWF